MEGFRQGLVLESLAALVESREMDIAGEAKIKPHKTAQSGTPRGVFSSRPPVQIHIHEDAKTGRMTVPTDAAVA